MKEYIGDAGFLYNSIEEAAEIISQPYPDEMRKAGFVQAKKSDIKKHQQQLNNLWKRL